jgi:hypothetical protein
LSPGAASVVTFLPGLVTLPDGLIALIAGLVTLLVGLIALVAGFITLQVSPIAFVLDAPQIILQRENLLGRGHGVALAEQFLDSCRQLELSAGIPSMAPV